ncbi:hypothetical protein FA09DRAFT_25730 [Tilletiopsis washingtonensis]|uniref:Uncharacterized protein n=1 Tax=Tilletiopsis washingtonensis TaxID=58919 RepID=A0A316ZDL4_9BASI|nr:hypothetical protein FA09DRAFT_25730 [Tilletiopsis washingtonensis]PWN98323.1 hypothetical protein FA09DRAFT_25730 [Tilletiopsis washingtonensis]
MTKGTASGRRRQQAERDAARHARRGPARRSSSSSSARTPTAGRTVGGCTARAAGADDVRTRSVRRERRSARQYAGMQTLTEREALPCCSCVRVPAEYRRHPGTSSEEHSRRPVPLCREAGGTVECSQGRRQGGQRGCLRAAGHQDGAWPAAEAQRT